MPSDEQIDQRAHAIGLCAGVAVSCGTLFIISLFIKGLWNGVWALPTLLPAGLLLVLVWNFAYKLTWRIHEKRQVSGASSVQPQTTTKRVVPQPEQADIGQWDTYRWQRRPTAPMSERSAAQHQEQSPPEERPIIWSAAALGLTDDEAVLLREARPADHYNGNHQAQLDLGKLLARRGKQREAETLFHYASLAGYPIGPSPYEE